MAKLKCFSIAIGILLAASLAGNVAQMQNYRELKANRDKEIATKDKEIANLQINFENASAKIDELNDKVDLLVLERPRLSQPVLLESGCYHRKTCNRLNDRGHLTGTVDDAIINGYFPCPYCMIDDGSPGLAAYEFKSKIQMMKNSGD